MSFSAVSTSEPKSAPCPPRFSISSSAEGHAARLKVSGELDVSKVPALDAVLRRAYAQASTVELDLQGLEFIDGSAAQLLLAADRRARRAGGRLSIVRCPADIAWLFEVLGIDRRLELVDATPSEAVVEVIPSGGPA